MAMITFSREDARFHSAVRDAGATVFGADSGPISPEGVEAGTSVASVASNGKGIAAFSTETGGANKFRIDGLPYEERRSLLRSVVVPGALDQLLLSDDGADWRPVATAELSPRTVDQPIPLPEPVPARFAQLRIPVSYTHLTLPTIYSV